MSPLSKSLEKRIHELTASIEAQKTELAAYERVLHMEVSKSTSSDESAAAPEMPESAPRKRRGRKATKKAVYKAPVSEPSAVDLSSVPFTGNKTSMVAEIVKSRGSEGATPKEVDAYFTAQNVSRSKNLIYNTLSYLVAQKKLKRREGKYFAMGGAAAPATKKAATKKTPTKRRLSPEGLKRIKEALKKRWAAKRAATAAAAKKGA